MDLEPALQAESAATGTTLSDTAPERDRQPMEAGKSRLDCGTARFSLNQYVLRRLSEAS